MRSIECVNRIIGIIGKQSLMPSMCSEETFLLIEAEVKAYASELESANARHTMGAIMRICPDCGDDMCGDNHKDCYKCQSKELAEALRLIQATANTPSAWNEDEWEYHSEKCAKMANIAKDTLAKHDKGGANE